MLLADVSHKLLRTETILSFMYVHLILILSSLLLLLVTHALKTGLSHFSRHLKVSSKP